MLKFSIIIPVYNVLKYLPECVSSVLQQSFNDYEIILVDDGSTDGSEKLCDQYAEKDSRIQVIHQENQGLSAARNAGIQAATGEFVLFLDSDDCYEQNNLLERIAQKTSGADIVVFNWKEFQDGQNYEECKVKEYLSRMQKEYVDGVSFLQDVTTMPLYPWYSWIYAYRKEFWVEQGFSFPTGIKYEDVVLTYKVLLAAKKILTAPDVWYCYRTARVGAITHTLKYQTEVDKLRSIEENIYDVQNRDMPEALKVNLCNNFSCLYYSAVIQSFRIEPKEDRKKFWDALQEKKWICQYTTEKKQKFVRSMINILGVPNTSALLNLRRIIKERRSL